MCQVHSMSLQDALCCPCIRFFLLEHLRFLVMVTDIKRKLCWLMTKSEMGISTSHFMFFLLLLFLIPRCTLEQTSSNISLGSSLSTGSESKWISPSGDFAFGFYRLPGTTNLYFLAIWFDKIPERTLVWAASSEDRPFQEGSELKFSDTGMLVLLDHQGREVWVAEPTGSTVVAASLLDTGNFVLINGSSSYIWESFDHPTDTLLPTQTLHVGNQLSSSRMAENKYFARSFALKLFDENLTLVSQAESSGFYWSKSALVNASKLVFNNSHSIYIELKNGSYYYLLQAQANESLADDLYSRATLGSDGVFRVYKYPKARNGSKPWVVSWAVPRQICQGMVSQNGFCGQNSYCKIVEDYQPICLCPRFYSFADPKNELGGCKPNFDGLSCGLDGANSMDRFQLATLSQVDWPFSDYSYYNNTDENSCRKVCMDDCQCVAAIYRNEQCWKKKLPLANGWADPSLESTVLFKVPKGSLSSRGLSSKKVIVGLGASIPIFFVVVSGIMFYLFKRKSISFCFFKKKQGPQNVQEFLENYNSLALKQYNHSDLKKMTKNFTNRLGEGGFGTVYRGQFPDGRAVAVKVLSGTEGDGEDFINEVATIGQTRHVNIVSLLGYCSEGRKRALIYEYMPKGSLDKFIYMENPGGTHSLDWDKLFQIAIGIARGLEYLHRWCNIRILHFDIKPHNILLDDDFCPKITDFGLAKLCPRKDGIMTSVEARGTRGYIAPEVYCVNFKGVSYKSDVYSYGMMVLEMVGGRQNYDPTVKNRSGIYFPQWAYNHLNQHWNLQLEGFHEMAAEEMAKKMTMTALWCIQLDPAMRPSMTKVVEMLEGKIEDIEIPPQPFFSSPPESPSSLQSQEC